MPRACPDVLLVALTVGCSTPATGPATAPVSRVVTTSAPVDWLVRTLLPPDRVPVELLLPAGEDAATWEPSTDQLVGLQQGALVVFNGAGFEPWVETSTVPLERRLDTSEAVALVEGPAVRHSHGAHAPHDHSGPDPHTWLDPLRFAQQAAAVSQGLTGLFPDEAEGLRAAQTALQTDLEQLDRDLSAALACLKRRPLAANHPTWTYWAEREALSIPVLSLEPGGPAAAAALDPVLAWAQANPKALLLWEGEPGDALRTALPGIEHLVLDPLESPPAGGAYDYRSQADNNVARIRALCTPDAGTPAP